MEHDTVIVAGGHELVAITCDLHANMQCGSCHGVFEGVTDAWEYPCDVSNGPDVAVGS